MKIKIETTIDGERIEIEVTPGRDGQVYLFSRDVFVPLTFWTSPKEQLKYTFPAYIGGDSAYVMYIYTATKGWVIRRLEERSVASGMYADV